MAEELYLSSLWMGNNLGVYLDSLLLQPTYNLCLIAKTEFGS